MVEMIIGKEADILILKDRKTLEHNPSVADKQKQKVPNV